MDRSALVWCFIAWEALRKRGSFCSSFCLAKHRAREEEGCPSRCRRLDEFSLPPWGVEENVRQLVPSRAFLLGPSFASVFPFLRILVVQGV